MYIKIPKEKIERIEIVKTDCKLSLSGVVSKYAPDYVINGGLYNMKTGKVNKIPLRIAGKTIATSPDGYWMMAWNEGPDIRMIHSRDMAKWKYAVACSAMLKDGANTIFTYTKDQGGIRGRTGFGDDDKNVHLAVTTDTNGPMSPEKLRRTMTSNNAKNAIMLDSGGSSQLYALGKYYQGEKRKVSYWICVWLKEDKSSCPFKEPTGIVKRNSRGEGVKWVQWHLDITTDGIFGGGTANAVIAFQRKYGLDADGIVGPATRKKLKEVRT